MGFLYVMSNSSMPGIVKIGVSSRHPDERASDLYTTGVPTPFIVEYYSSFGSRVWEAEKESHKKLSSSRVSDSREFFHTSVNEAILIIQSLGIPYDKIYIRNSYNRKQIVKNQVSIDIKNREQAKKCEEIVEKSINIKEIINSNEEKIKNLKDYIKNHGQEDNDLWRMYLIALVTFFIGFSFYPVWLATVLFLYSAISIPMDNKKTKIDLKNNLCKLEKETKQLLKTHQDIMNNEQRCRKFLHEYYVKLIAELPTTKHREKYKIDQKILRYGLSSTQLGSNKIVNDIMAKLRSLSSGSM